MVIQLIQNGYFYVVLDNQDSLWEPLTDFMSQVNTGKILPDAYSIKCITWDNSIVNHPQPLMCNPPLVYFFYSYLHTCHKEIIKYDVSMGSYNNYHTLLSNSDSNGIMEIAAHVQAEHGIIVPESPKQVSRRIVEILDFPPYIGKFAYSDAEVEEGVIVRPIETLDYYNRPILVARDRYRTLSKKEEFALRLKYGL